MVPTQEVEFFANLKFIALPATEILLFLRADPDLTTRIGTAVAAGSGTAHADHGAKNFVTVIILFECFEK